MLFDEEFINELAPVNKGLVQRVFEAIKDLFDKVFKRYDKTPFINLESEAAMKLLHKEYDRIKGLYESALKDTKKVQTEKGKVADDGGVMYSKSRKTKNLDIAISTGVKYNEHGITMSKTERERVKRILREYWRRDSKDLDKPRKAIVRNGNSLYFYIYKALDFDSYNIMLRAKVNETNEDIENAILEVFENDRTGVLENDDARNQDRVHKISEIFRMWGSNSNRSALRSRNSRPNDDISGVSTGTSGYIGRGNPERSGNDSKGIRGDGRGELNSKSSSKSVTNLNNIESDYVRGYVKDDFENFMKEILAVLDEEIEKAKRYESERKTTISKSRRKTTAEVIEASTYIGDDGQKVTIVPEGTPGAKKVYISSNLYLSADDTCGARSKAHTLKGALLAFDRCDITTAPSSATGSGAVVMLPTSLSSAAQST